MTGQRATSGAIAPPRPRSLGLLLGVIALAIALWPLLGGTAPLWWLVGAGCLSIGVALLRPGWLRPAAIAWAWLGQWLHWVVNPVVMAVLYFLVLTPVGLLRRIFHRDPLGLARDPALPSYLKPHPQALDPDSLKRQF